MRSIIRNMARCRLCGEVIESRSTHDMVRCRCGAIGVDGGRGYLRRIGNETDIEELSVQEDRS
jgi:hypothetical protein